MSRVAHSVPMKAYDHITKLLTEAGGKDGKISRDNAEALVGKLREEGRGTEAVAAHNLFKMIDMRDNESGHQVTAYDLKKDRSFVEAKLLENRDVNNDGYSAAEIANMSPAGRALVELGQALEIKASRARVAHHTPEAGLFHVAAMIRAAAKSDLISSVKDIDAYADKLYLEGRGTESLALRNFAGFINHRDAAPGSRITDADITRAVDYAIDSLLRNKDKNHDGYSKKEVNEFSPSAKGFLLIGKMIENGIIESAMPTNGADARKALAKAASGQEFDQMGSEGGQKVKAVFRDGNYNAVTETNFRRAFKMPNRDIQVIEKFTAEDLRTYIENNASVWKDGEQVTDAQKADRAFAATAMLRSLKDLKVIVTGKGDEGLLATYIVGIAPDKSMVGIQTGVVWT